MATSRLQRIGTIYSRINGLLKSGAMKQEDQPIWYKIYEAFPPRYPPRYDRVAPNTELTKILYPEDVARAKFQKSYPKQLGLINLSDTKKETRTQKCLKMYDDFKSRGISDEEAFAQIIEELGATAEKFADSQRTTDKPTLAESFKKAHSINISDIFKDK